ncbi:SUF system NifU family Fe-S cluster assembly protein [Candidatus Peregrinibacteria bacterium]|nr:SUF system NifU family Fe-S cluster assembly protein [Candidatus Peregrinibacteria bacterium]
MDLYAELILDHYKNPRNFKELEKADIVFEDNNPLCGDKVKIFLKVENEQIKEVSFMGVGCAISIAASSMISEIVMNKTYEDVFKIDKNQVEKMMGAELSVSRVKCAMLGLSAIKKAIKILQNEK